MSLFKALEGSSRGSIELPECGIFVLESISSGNGESAYLSVSQNR